MRSTGFVKSDLKSGAHVNRLGMFQLKSARVWDPCMLGWRGEGLLPPVLIVVSLCPI